MRKYGILKSEFTYLEHEAWIATAFSVKNVSNGKPVTTIQIETVSINKNKSAIYMSRTALTF